MTNPQENNSEHKHNRQPKWIFAVVFIAAVVIICIATVLINRNSDKSTDGENSTTMIRKRPTLSSLPLLPPRPIRKAERKPSRRRQVPRYPRMRPGQI